MQSFYPIGGEKNLQIKILSPLPLIDNVERFPFTGFFQRGSCFYTENPNPPSPHALDMKG